MRIKQKGDFIGFSFNGKHSSELGIVRTSNGSRYDDNLLPTSQDKTAAVPGGDGTYYWETNYTQKPINISFAFDSLEEEEYRELRRVFNAKNVGKFIYDENPYKYYMAKPTGNLQIKSLCFDEERVKDGVKKMCRIYKGEGTVQFTCYYPYAKSVHKWLEEYSDSDYPNKNEWAGASGMKENKGNYDGIGEEVHLYNPGDLEADIYIYLDFDENGVSKVGTITLSDDKGDISKLSFESFNAEENDKKFRINSKTNLVEGVDENNNITGNLYNRYITSGDFFKVPLGESKITCSQTSLSVEYDYIYY